MKISSEANGFVPSPGRAAEAAETFRMASATPSQEQRANACRDLLFDVQRTLQELKDTLSNLDDMGMSQEEIFRGRNTGELIRSKLDEALTKIGTLRSQCRDVLSPEEVRQIDELERKLREIKGRMEDQGQHLQIDWNELGRSLTDALGFGLNMLAGAILWVLQRVFGGREAY